LNRRRRPWAVTTQAIPLLQSIPLLTDIEKSNLTSALQALILRLE